MTAERRAGSGLARIMSPRRETFEAIFDTVFHALAVGLFVGVSAIPFVAAATVVAQPLAAWPFLALSALPVGPGIVGAFACFDAARGEGEVRVFRTFWRAYGRGAGRALVVSGAVLALGIIVVVDVFAVWGTPFAALVGPLLGVVSALAAVTAVNAFAGIARSRETSLRGILTAALMLSVRRWPVSLLTLVIVVAWAGITLAQPVIGVLGLGGFALYAIWSNAVAAHSSIPAAS
jgi:uncharacterized membrane protein YesL